MLCNFSAKKGRVRNIQAERMLSVVKEGEIIGSVVSGHDMPYLN